MTSQSLPQPEEVLPHRSPMILIDAIDEVTPDGMQAHLRIDENSLFYEQGKGVPVWVGIEYMAQTVAALIGEEARQKCDPVKMGFLLGTRNFTTSTTYFALGQKIVVRVERQLQMGELCQFNCRTLAETGEELAICQISAFMPKDSNVFFKAQGL